MSAPLANLPLGPTPPPAPQAGASPPAAVSVSEMRDFVSPKLYGELSWDDHRTADDVTRDCIERAYTVAAGLLAVAGQKPNPYSATQRMVVKLLTLSELFRYNDDKRGYERNLEQAAALITARYRVVPDAIRYPFAASAKAPKLKRGDREI